MKSPWKSLSALEPQRDYLVFASDIPARSWSSTPGMFRGASEVRKQLERSEGLMGFSLLARPLRKQYATLSIWVDEQALANFANSNPHHVLMAKLSPEMGPTRFARWTITGANGRPSWKETLGRLSTA